MSRFRFLATAAVILASLGPVAAHAQVITTPDAATEAALLTFRTSAADMVTSLPDNKGVSSDDITASYLDGGLAGVPDDRINTIMVVRQWAEAAAWDQLDSSQKDLIRTFWDSTATAVASTH